MPWRTRRVLTVVLMFVLFLAGGWSDRAVHSQAEILRADAPVGDAITYQGWLQQNDVAVQGVCDLRFSLFDAAANGTQVGSTLERANHAVNSGYFTVSDLDFGAVFTGAARWLAVAVRCPAGSGNFTTLTPRQPLTPAPYALYAANNWALLGNAGTSVDNFVGTSDAVTLTLKVSDTVAFRLLPNDDGPSIVGGISANSVNPGVLGATIAGGGGINAGFTTSNRVTDDYGVVSGGSGNQAGDNAGTTSDRTFATVGGGTSNAATGAFATIGGGKANSAIAQYGTVGGGVENNAFNDGGTVSGGAENAASADYATVGGGIENVASGKHATIGGGLSNEATDENATVGGGRDNVAAAAGTVAGGTNNQADMAATVGGGSGNLASYSYATIGGGVANKASGQYAVVSGGTFNESQANYTVVGGGNQNIAATEGAVVAGGYDNQASGSDSTISGGSHNVASNGDSTVSGGSNNEATGSAATIGGGRFNLASGNFSTVSGGVDANASHPGEWAYASGGFANAQIGEAQTSLYVLRGTTTDTGSTILALTDFGDRLTIAPGRTVVFDIQIAARGTGSESAGYTAQGVIENQLGVTSLIGAVAFPLTREDDTAWSIAVAADDTNDSLRITVTGANGDNIRWVATVRTTEVQN